jgi:general secretion pathway protein I
MRGDRGFTLLEVMVALAIAAIALAVMVRTAGEGVMSVQTAGAYEEAVSRAKSHLAALEPDLAPLEGEHEGDDGGGFRWRLRITPVAVAKPREGDQAAATTSARKALYAVEVGIDWRTGGRNREVLLRTERISARKSG